MLKKKAYGTITLKSEFQNNIFSVQILNGRFQDPFGLTESENYNYQSAYLILK